MPWIEIEPGHFQRPIGENERFIKAIGDRGHDVGREHWSVTAYATFTIHASVLTLDDVTQWLRQAWKGLRFQHPSIASIASDETLDYFVPNALDLENWANETFTVIKNTQDVNDVIASLKPSRYVTGYYLPHTSQFILHLAHWRTDGYGALQLLNAFFEACALGNNPEDLPWGSEISRLVPTVEEALNNPTVSTSEIHAAADRYLSTVALANGAVGVARQTDLSTPPAGTRGAHLRFPSGTTEAITKACEVRGISVLAAVHASTASTTYHFADPESKDKPYTSTMRFSLRPYLSEPYNNPSVAAGIYTGGYMFQVPASQSWLENARQYHHEYENGVSHEFLVSRRQYAKNVFVKMKTPSPPRTPPSEIDISFVDAPSLIQPWHDSPQGRIEVTGVSVGVETLTRQMYCFTWTFRQCLELYVVYNEAFYERNFVEEVVQAVAGILKQQLEIAI
ncbi:hypothetical protein BDV09DRAFT_180138 [Aspergillus tetrazonus]